MWSSRLFWKLFASYAALILGTTIAFSLLMSAYQSAQIRSRLQQRLRDDAVLLRALVMDQLVADSHATLQASVMQLARETLTRITITDQHGAVLADSDQDPNFMENHSGRPEIEAASRAGVGVGVHLSRTLGIPMMYLAMRVDRNE